MKNITKLSLAFVLLASSTSIFAESRYSYESDGATTPTAVTADIKFEIIIPEIMILKIGTAGATIDTVKWALGMDAAGALTTAGGDADNIVYTGAVAPAGAGADPAAVDGDATVAVGVWGNVGDIGFTSALTTFTGGVGTAPLATEITATDGGNLTHPTFAAGAASIGATAGIVDKTDTWTYKYDPAALAGAGKWTATATYTITAP